MSDTKKLELDIINAVIFDRGANDFALANLTEEYFSTELGKIGWGVITGILRDRQEINVITFNEGLIRRGRKVSEYLLEDTFGSCASIARELVVRYKIQKVGEYYREMMQKIGSGEAPEESISAYMNKLIEINNIGITEETAFRPAVNDYIDHLVSLASGQPDTGYSWGIETIDQVAGKIEPGRIYVIGALKKTGKSRFIISTMDNLLKSRVPVFFISLEMTRQDVVSWLATKNVRKIFDGKVITPEMTRQFGLVAPQLAEYPLWVSDMPSDIARIEGMIRRHVAAFGTKVVFLDYFQQIRRGSLKGNSMASVMDAEAARLQQIAKELKVALVYLSQMPVEAERMKDEGKKAGIGYLKGCGGIAEAADLIMILDNEERNKANDNNKQTISATVWGRRCVSGKTVKLTADLGILEFLPQAEQWQDK